MTPDFKRGVEAALAACEAWFSEHADGDFEIWHAAAEARCRMLGADWPRTAAGHCEMCGCVCEHMYAVEQAAPTADPAAVSEAVEDAIDEYGNARYEDGAAEERHHHGTVGWTAEARAKLNAAIAAQVAAVRAEQAAPDLAALRAAVHDYRTGWAVQADNAFPGPVDRIIAAATALVATPPAAWAAPVVSWVRGLSLEQLQDAESACACWPTREGAAEALRRALLILAYGKKIDRRAIRNQAVATPPAATAAEPDQNLAGAEAALRRFGIYHVADDDRAERAAGGEEGRS